MHIVLDVSGRVWPCMDNSSQQCKGVFGSETAWNGMEWNGSISEEWNGYIFVRLGKMESRRDRG